MFNICHCFLSPLHQKMAKILWMAQFFARILYGDTNMDPHLLWKQPRPPLIIWAHRRPEKVHAQNYCVP
jgi:hypothetical protein